MRCCYSLSTAVAEQLAVDLLSKIRTLAETREHHLSRESRDA